MRSAREGSEDKGGEDKGGDGNGSGNILGRLANDDKNLRRITPEIIEDRRRWGLQGLVGGLQAIIINTEPERQSAAAWEMISRTGLRASESFDDGDIRGIVLKTRDYSEFHSAHVIITSRKDKNGQKGRNRQNPFRDVNSAPKSAGLPETRLETFVFETRDIERYVEIQGSRGVGFLGEITHRDNFSFVQTPPSPYTGNSIGLIQWTGDRGVYGDEGADVLRTPPEISPGTPTELPHTMPPKMQPAPPMDRPYRENIRWIDHAATRVEAEHRDEAIIEFMKLTNHNFDAAFYVPSLNSITSVARLSPCDFSMVFTSGITPYVSDEASGPTEKFIHNYGARVHHIAFQTEEIEETFKALGDDGMKFLTGLVGSRDEGLKQTFSMPSENTLLVNEYIYRYEGFDGFFTRSNVSVLTEATGRQ